MKRLACAILLFAIAAPAPAADAVAQRRFDQGRQLRKLDSVRALGMIEQAAAGGHAAAMFILSGMLAQGEGAAPDPQASRLWLERAADLENPEALQQLAMNLQHGLAGYPRDEVRAAQLMRQVAHALKHRAHDH